MSNAISAQTTVNEAVRRCPESIRIFSSVGIDTCCGGSLPIAEAARRHQVDAAHLLAAIEALACEDEVSLGTTCDL